MFNFHYPNVGMTEISNFGNTLKNDKPNDESILKITKCVYNDETYAIVKYNKENLIWYSLSNSIGLLNCYNMIFIKKYLFLI